MFEKSLYDLIRGLRNHKGREKDYIQASIRECRQEIKSQDMDLKATALLKLTYLEMYGYDMSWASFNVLEVMSSPKYHQKRIGYLSGVQSFRPDTEVLLLAENLLKKDLMSAQATVISLPLIAIPHVINPPMANSLLSELLPRMNHSSPLIRKKAIVTLYRLALVLPETLRPTWPKIKERLLDEGEDPSVTAAVVNVICELGWRRPRDFLPLAPRLFGLLVHGNNNWMAIKIIKLFASLIPLEPRLVKKLLPPLTDIIKTTPAMSLLYECIHGIVQGGILESMENTIEGEEIARLCVAKLRGMLPVDGDPNLKYVALLSFKDIVVSHPHLVIEQQDAILECIDDPDISIRTRALDLVVGMVNSANLTAIVGRLMRQLRNAPIDTTPQRPRAGPVTHGVEIAADFGDDDPAERLRKRETPSDQPLPLPDDYRTAVIKRVLEMCSHDKYSNVDDFHWYIDVLVQLVRVSPCTRFSIDEYDSGADGSSNDVDGVSNKIGDELQNVAVRVRSVRTEAVEAAQSLVLTEKREQMFPLAGNGGQGVLDCAVWIVGEFAELLTNPHGVMSSLLHESVAKHRPRTLAIYVQAIPKLFASLTADERISWTPERKSMVSVLLNRIVHFLEPLASHSNLDVQERVAEYLELMKLASEAVITQQATDRDQGYTEPPLLLTQAIPSLFTGSEINPVAPEAQRKVPLPEELDLDTPINSNLQTLLSEANKASFSQLGRDPVAQLYYNRPHTTSSSTSRQVTAMSASDRLNLPGDVTQPKISSRSDEETSYFDADIVAKRQAERSERYRDDPFYIGQSGLGPPSSGRSGPSTPLHNIIKSSNNGEELDIDAIPIMNLDLGGQATDQQASQATVKREPASSISGRTQRPAVEIAGDDDLDAIDVPSLGKAQSLTQARGKKSLLEVDSSGLRSLSLEDEDDPRAGTSRLEIERKAAEDAEMVRLMKEVERARLEMQRAQERIQAKEGEDEAIVVRRKKTKKKASFRQGDPIDHIVSAAGNGAEPVLGPDDAEAIVKRKKKKKKDTAASQDPSAALPEGGGVVKKKKKKKKKRITEQTAIEDI